MAKQINTPATTATSKGTVTQIIGEVKVISASGETRVLQVGDKINIGDTIQTGANGAVAIAFDGAGSMSLGHSDSLSITAELLANILKPAASAADDAARIQELIAQGADPTQVAAASAAGAGEGENAGHTAVALDAPNSRVGIETGFPTEGISVAGFNVLVDPPSGEVIPAVLNTPPVANNDNSTGAENDALTTAEDHPIIITPATLLANDVDADGDTLTIISVQAAVNGSVALVNGNVVFTPNPNYNGPASFTYTVTDGKGGVATATVNINVTPIGEPDVAVIDENGLAAGDNSIVENSKLPVTGTFILSADEGIAQINIAGVVITLVQLNALGSTPLTITTELGSLSLTGFNADTGVVSYSYAVESGAQNHSAGDDSVLDHFNIVLTDGIGQTSSDTLDILITDTAPIALHDQREMSEDENQADLVQITGNVIANGAVGDVADTQGADAMGVSQVQGNSSDDAGNFVIDGMYGHLTLNQDGSYTYTLYTKAEADAARNNNNDEDGDNTADDYIFQGYDAIQSLAASKTISSENGSSQTIPAETVSEVFTYTLRDSDGDSSSATLTIHINGTNDRPHISLNQSAVVVSEEGLSNANLDNVLLNDPASSSSDPADAAGNPTTAHGSFTVGDPDTGDTLSVALLDPGESPDFTSGGATVLWALSSDGHTLTGYVGSNTADNTVLTITLTQGSSGSWSYDVELFKPINHPNTSFEDVRSLSFGIQVSDSSHATNTATLTVNIEDDMPVASNQTVNADIPTVNTNLVLSLDISGSMGSGPGSRMELAKAALLQLIDQYDNLGDVKVMLVTFSGGSSLQGGTTHWLDAATAKAILTGITTDGGSTNYDSPLQQVIDHFGDAGKLTSGNVQNIAYFMSDGQPNINGSLTYTPDAGNDTGAGIGPNDMIDWQNFLSANHINSLAYGMGTGVTAGSGSGDNDTLDPIAFNGITASNTDSVLVPNVGNLPNALLDSVQLVSMAFNLASAGGFGADGGHVASVTVDGHVFGFDGKVDGSLVFASTLGSYNASTHVWTINSNGTTANNGSIVVDMDTGVGAYKISPNSSLVERIDFTLIDNDGDSASGSLTYNLNAPPTISINTGELGNANDSVYESALASGSNPSSTAEFALGTITLSDPNGALNTTLASITVGGTTVALNAIMSGSGHTFVGVNGDLTISNYHIDAATGKGVADYKYELKTPTTDLAGTESNSFNISVSDGSLHSAPQTLTINIVDDAPLFTIINDGADSGRAISIATPNPASTTSYSGQFADWHFGADGAATALPTLSSTSGNVSINTSLSSSTSLKLDLKDSSGNNVALLTLNADGTDSIQVLPRAYTAATDTLLTTDVTASGPALSKTINSSISGLIITVTGSDGDAILNENNDEVNPSEQGWAVGDNQIDRGESLTFSFNQAVNQFSFTANGFTGSPNDGSDAGRAGDVGLTIRVYYDAAKTVFEDFSNVNVNKGASVQVADLAGFGMTVGNTVYNSFYAVNILSDNSQDANDGFRLNNITVTKFSSIPPADLDYSFTLNIVDGDGDLASQQFKVHLDGDSTGGLTLEAIAGTSGVDTLTGTSSNDSLIGGGGNDILNGDTGSDLFVFANTASNNGVDTIQNFTAAAKASGGDVLDITDLLSGAGVSEATFYSGTNEGTFLKLVSSGSDTQVWFDADGNSSGAAVQVATLTGVGTDPATLLNTLLNNGEIQTHH